MAEQSLEGTKARRLAGPQGDVPRPEFTLGGEEEAAGFRLYYYMWLSRLFIFFALVSLGFFACASLVLFKTAPEVSVEPFLVIRQDASAGIVRHEPIAPDMSSRQQLMEAMVRSYVVMRNSFVDDQTEMNSRWRFGGIVSYLSAPRVYADFWKKYDKDYGSLFAQGRSTETEIISVSKGAEGSWKVDFKTYSIFKENRAPGTQAPNVGTKYWTASLAARFVPGRMFMGRRLLNPLGFTVTRYTQAEVEL